MKAPKEIRATKVSDKGKDENEDESEKGKKIKRIKNNQKYFANQTKKKKKSRTLLLVYGGAKKCHSNIFLLV